MLWFNFICWFLPPFFVKGNLKYFIFLISFLFSSSYWIPLVILPQAFNTYSIKEEYFPNVLFYSLISGIAFYMGLFLQIKNAKANNINIDVFLLIISKINFNKKLYILLRFLMVICLVYSYTMAISQIGIAGRVEFMDEISPFWYAKLLNIMGFMMCFIVFYEFQNKFSVKGFSYYFTHLLLLLFIFLVGFDGSRRLSLLPTFTGIGFLTIKMFENQKIYYKSLFFYFFIFLFTSFLSLNRDFLVGWQIFNLDFNLLWEYKEIMLNMLFAPSSTLHVNTQMSQYIVEEGVQGYGYYFRAIGNTLFPNFIFGTYFFGEPLVVYLHEKFGWYGQDFGFLAEAIYSGGTVGVFILHFLMGLFIGFAIKKSNAGSIFCSILLFGILFGFVNSLRSDFMNLLKAMIYPTLVGYLFYLFFKKFLIQKLK